MPDNMMKQEKTRDVIDIKNQGEKRSNALKKQVDENQQIQAARKQKYESLLGTWLGGELYKIVHKELSPDKIMNYIVQGSNQLIDLIKQNKAVAEGLNTIKDKTGQDLLGIAKGLAAKAIKENQAVQSVANKINEIAETQPVLVVATAILAGIAAYLSNMDVPKLKSKFKISDGLTGELGVGLGKLQEIALESVHAALTYNKNSFTFKLKGDYNKGKDGNPDRYRAAAEAELRQKQLGLKERLAGSYEVQGDRQRLGVEGGVYYNKKGTSINATGKYNETRVQGELEDQSVTLGLHGSKQDIFGVKGLTGRAGIDYTRDLLNESDRYRGSAGLSYTLPKKKNLSFNVGGFVEGGSGQRTNTGVTLGFKWRF